MHAVNFFQIKLLERSSELTIGYKMTTWCSSGINYNELPICAHFGSQIPYNMFSSMEMPQEVAPC